MWDFASLISVARKILVVIENHLFLSTNRFRPRPKLGLKNMRCARIVLGGIEVARMIAKGR
jgi:hypothetical protein